MAATIKCPGCQATLRVRDDMAGKSVKCPRCGNAVPVPAADVADVVPVEPAVVEAVTAERPAPAAPMPPEGKRACPECGEFIPRTASRCRFCRAEIGAEPEPEEDEEPVRRKSRFEPCPQCEATNPRVVSFTWWGSFYFTKLFHHVRCRACGYGYNGYTGKSNITAAIICVTVPLLIICGILVFIFIILRERNYL
jgi:predicted Zn finger-like uncharacterized protein